MKQLGPAEEAAIRRAYGSHDRDPPDKTTTRMVRKRDDLWLTEPCGCTHRTGPRVTHWWKGGMIRRAITYPERQWRWCARHRRAWERKAAAAKARAAGIGA